MKATIPIALQPGTRALRLERVPTEFNDENGAWVACGYWRIWLHHDAQLTQGTILRLYDNGRIEQVTLDTDGIESNLINIKGPDSAN